MDNQFVNVSSGTVFHSPRQLKGKVYKKNVRYWVARYSGFAMDYRVFLEVQEQGKDIVFVCKNDLIDYYLSRKRNRTVVACSKGEYFVSLNDMALHGRVDTLREKDGEQIFIGANFCTKIK